jgi:hypothetical protein
MLISLVADLVETSSIRFSLINNTQHVKYLIKTKGELWIHGSNSRPMIL